jgi:hypothetical protein
MTNERIMKFPAPIDLSGAPAISSSLHTSQIKSQIPRETISRMIFYPIMILMKLKAKSLILNIVSRKAVYKYQDPSWAIVSRK